jgi:fatty acid synthase, animal type
VKVSTSDITTRSGCEELIKTANGLGPVGGIFNLAVVLRDEHFAKQNIENFEECFKPKSSSTKYLDEISRISCSELDHFVFFSSVSCGRGNGAQSNYGYSNSFAENIIEKRQRENLPGKVIQFGPIKDVGLLSEVASDLIGCFGFLFQDIKSCCEVLDEILLRNEPIFSSMICASKEKSMNNFDDLFGGLLARIGLTNDSSIDENQTLTNIGVDSISGVEIQQFFSREMGINMTLKELRSKTVKEAKELCLKIKKN